MMPSTADTRQVDVAPTRAHIQWLRSEGATLRGIARASGVSHHIVMGIAGGRQRTTAAQTAARIATVTPEQALRPPNRGGRSYPGQRRRVWAEDLEVLVSDGLGVDDIVARLGLRHRDYLLRWIHRNDRQDLLRRMRANDTRQAVA